jgi:hypothetical protein
MLLHVINYMYLSLDDVSKLTTSRTPSVFCSNTNAFSNYSRKIKFKAASVSSASIIGI